MRCRDEFGDASESKKLIMQWKELDENTKLELARSNPMMMRIWRLAENDEIDGWKHQEEGDWDHNWWWLRVKKDQDEGKLAGWEHQNRIIRAQVGDDLGKIFSEKTKLAARKHQNAWVKISPPGLQSPNHPYSRSKEPWSSKITLMRRPKWNRKSQSTRVTAPVHGTFDLKSVGVPGLQHQNLDQNSTKPWVWWYFITTYPRIDSRMLRFDPDETAISQDLAPKSLEFEGCNPVKASSAAIKEIDSPILESLIAYSCMEIPL